MCIQKQGIPCRNGCARNTGTQCLQAENITQHDSCDTPIFRSNELVAWGRSHRIQGIQPERIISLDQPT
jgi:hypothetical protein